MGKNKNDSYARLEEEVSMTLQQTYEGMDKCMKNELLFESKELRQSYLFVSLLVCDACVVTKSYLNSTCIWEQIYSVKQMYVMMNEGTKKLVGFNKRTVSSYVKLLDNFVKAGHLELLPQWTQLKCDVEAYADISEIQEAVKFVRSFAIHHDDELNSDRLINNLKAINNNEAFQLFTGWIMLLNKMLCFFGLLIMK